MTRHPSIGKAPNDGGGELEMVKSAALWLKENGELAASEAVDRLVKRVEESEKAGEFMGGLCDEQKATIDTLKSKLSEAEKAISELLDLATVEALTGEQDARRDDVFASAGETLARLRADGGGRGEEKI